VLSQVREAAPRHERIRILDRNHRTTDARLDDAWRAWPGPTGMAARLERAEQCSAARTRTRVGERADLGMRTAGELVCASPDDDAVLVDDQRPDHRIRTGSSSPALGERQRAFHIGGHGVHRAVVICTGGAHHFS
jgi:hypothetical protein